MAGGGDGPQVATKGEEKHWVAWEIYGSWILGAGTCTGLGSHTQHLPALGTSRLYFFMAAPPCVRGHSAEHLCSGSKQGTNLELPIPSPCSSPPQSPRTLPLRWLPCLKPPTHTSVLIPAPSPQAGKPAGICGSLFSQGLLINAVSATPAPIASLSGSVLRGSDP